MKKIILFFSLIPLFSIAQVGIGTTDPRTTLDVNGAITNREVSFAVASNAVNISTETSLARITGVATSSIAVTSFTPTVNGCRLIISNTTSGGFGATFAGMTIPNGQAIEFVYTNGTWKTTAGGTGAANNIYNSNGTLSGNRTVTLGANTLTFNSTAVDGFSVDGTTFSVDATNNRVGIGTSSPTTTLDVGGNFKIYGNAIGDFSGPELRPHVNMGSFTVYSGVVGSGTPRFTVTNGGNVGIGTLTPTAQFHTTGSVRFAGAGTPALNRVLVSDATGLATWQKQTATNTDSNAIVASATQVAVPSTNVQGAISDLATAIKTVSANDWKLDGNSNGVIKKFGTIDGFDVPFITGNVERMRILSNGNVGIGSTNPTKKLTVENGSIRPAIGNTQDSGISFPTDIGGGSGDEAFIRYYVESGENTKLSIGTNNDFDDDISFFQAGAERMNIYNGNVGIGINLPTAQLHTTGSVRFAGAGTPILGRSLVTDATGLATWQNPLASNSTSTAIAASATQVAVPSTNVQGAIGDLATAIRTAQNSTIYTSDGTLTSNRTVTQGANTLTFNSTAVNGFSVDGTTFSVDGTNNRVGIGNIAPNLSLDVTSGNGIGTKVSNTSQWDHLYLFSDTVSSYITAGGADNGLQFRVGNGASGTYGGQTYTNAMTIMPSGNIGIGTTIPNAPLQFANTIANRKTVFWQDGNNEHQFYGLGINANTLRYQVSSTSANHTFFAGTGASASNELMRIQGNGNVGIGATNPQQRLDVNGNVRIRSNNTIYYQDLADYRLAIREDYETAVTGWTNNTRTTVLGQNILGGFNVLSTTPNQKTFDLTGVPHTTVKIKFSYYSVDSWDGENAYVKVAGTGAGWQRAIIYTEIMRDNIVGGAWNDGIYYGEIEVPHTSNTLTIIVGSTLDQVPNDESFGIDNVEIWVR